MCSSRRIRAAREYAAEHGVRAHMSSEPTVFPGQADHRTFGFAAADGTPTEALYSICQVIKGGGPQPIEALGTGFFITNAGLFVTAKHVLTDVLNENLEPTHPLTLIQFLPDDDNVPRVLLRPIHSMLAHRGADVAVGIPQTGVHKKTGKPLRNKIWPLCFQPPPPGAYVATYTLPKTRVTPGDKTEIHIEPRLFDGLIREIHLQGRDKVMLPGPCAHTSIHIHGGASGGPVFGKDGLVFGVNSTGIDGTDVGFVSLLDCIREMHLENANLAEGEPLRRVPFTEMIQRGHIVVREPSANAL